MKYSGKLTLTNDFHHTEATVIVKNGIIKASAIKRAEKKLCGMSDCSCGSIRGPQEKAMEEINSATLAQKLGANIGDWRVEEK